jgi:CheY-like chemotaxis protein
MPDGGRLLIETRMLFDGSDGRPNEAAADRVRLSVSDDGIGMDVATRRRIFEPFFTTKEPGKGTGLGLATAYGTIHQLQGHIAVESTPGRGTSFHIDLPALDAQAEPDPPDRQAGGGGAGSEVVLVVEDDDVVRRIAVKSLERRGYQVAQAPGGLRALELIDSGELVPELLVTDVIMPGMDGKTLADELQARLPALRVLYTSGYEDETVARHGVLEPGLAFLAKPYSPEQLAGKVRAILDGEEPATDAPAS